MPENTLVRQLIEENLRTKNPYLDLGNCGLDGTEPELELLAECEHLEALVFSNKWEEYDEKEQVLIAKLSQNEGATNKLIQIPSFLPPSLKKLVSAGVLDNKWKILDLTPLRNLHQIQVLNLSFNKVRDIYPLQNLFQLSYLDLKYNLLLQDISPIKSHQKLWYLNLFENHITDIYISNLSGLKFLKFLDIGRNALKNFSLEGTVSLEKINLVGNHLYSITLKNLSFLKKLELNGLIVHKISLEGISGLESLSLDGCKNIEDYLFLKKLYKLKFLSCENCNISNIDFLNSNYQLSYLNLKNNNIQDITPLQGLPELQILNLKNNNIQDITPLQGLPELQILNLKNNNIQDITPFLQGFTKLHSLFLGGDYIKNTTPLNNLCSLQTLKLKFNEIDNLALQSLKELNSLTLKVANINTIFLIDLKEIRKVDLSKSLIKKSIFINNLAELNELKISNINIDDIQACNTPKIKSLIIQNFKSNNLSFLENFTELETLDLSGFEGENLFLKDLCKLSFLDLHFLYDINLKYQYPQNIHWDMKYVWELYYEDLKEVLEEIKPIKKINLQNLCSIKILDLKKLKIEELVLIHLDNLEKLDISNNNLQIFHYEDLRKLPKIEYLKLYGNPIQNIPAEIFDKDENVLQDVRDYFLELEKGKIINEKAKLIIVGNGRVGKTSLFKRLKGDDFDTNEKYTHGIQIGELAKKDLAEAKTENLQLKVWDFGGQEIFYATHQFFMGDDAIYILAWTKEENVKAYRERDKATLPTDEKWQSLEYWLDTIRRHAPNSPILVVQTHSDCSNEHINQSVLSQESSANDFFNFSAAKDFGLAEIKNALTQKLNQLPMYGYEFPKTYENVILQIENRQKAGENIITYQTFVDTICRLANISEGGEDTLLDYLDKSGVVVYYKNHPKLKNLIYINPNWLTQQVYRLINNELHKTEGKISLKYLEMHLPDYEQFGLLDLFQQFELIFKVKEEKEKYWIAPQYLLEKRSDEFHEAIEDEIKAYNLFVYRFERFVPDNLMINFISRYGSFSKKTYWKNGIKFTKEVEKEFLVCITIYKPESKSFFIYTQKHSNQKSLLKRIVNDFIELGKNAKTEFSFDNQDFVSYQKLQKLYEKGAKEIESIDGNILKISDFTFLFKEEEPNNNMKNQTFIQQLNEATELKISELLGIIKNQYEKIPWDLRNDFNNLKQEFKDQPNNFALSKWKAKMITLVNDFDFEITVDNVEIITQPPNNMSNQQNAKDENGKIVINFNPIITNNNTNTNQNSNSQSFNFEAFAQALPNFQSYLSLLEEEFEKIEKKNPNNQVITNAKELVKDTLESANKIESITEKKDEKEIKKSTFWKRLGNFGNWLFKSGKELLSPDSIQNIGKSGNELAKLGQAFGIETGFDFSNFGSE